VNIAGNPISQLDEYKAFVIAYLTNVEYLDYRLIDQATVSVIGLLINSSNYAHNLV